MDLCKDVSENIKNNNSNIDIKFKVFYTEASSYLQIGKIELDEKQNKVKKDLSNDKTYHTSNFAAAKSSFEKAIEIIPNDEYAWIGRGNSSFELKDYRGGIFKVIILLSILIIIIPVFGILREFPFII